MTSPGLCAMSVIGTGAFVGLAVWGEGGWAAFFSHLPLTALAVITIVMTTAACCSNVNLSPGEKEDRRNRWVLSGFGVLALLTAWLPAWTDRNDIWTFGG